MSQQTPLSMAPAPEPALKVLRGLKAAGFEAYFVGGCARDRLLGRPVNDWDIATDAEPQQVVDLFDKTIPTGLQHGTVTVMEAAEPFEVTTYRVEIGYSDGRRPDVVHFTRSLEDDLSRRDFTVNAMAWDADAGRLVDPFGGQIDLAKRIIRAVGAADDRFGEDGLRALRAVRFATVLDFEIAPETWAAIPRTLDTFRKVSAERIRVELMKTLLAPRAAWGVGALRDSGLLAVFLPAVARVEAPVWSTLVARIAGITDPLIRLAALLSPLGKGADRALRALKFSTAERTRVTGCLAFAEVDPAGVTTASAVRALLARIGRSTLPDVLEYHRAGVLAPEWRGFEARLKSTGAASAALKPSELPVSGKTVMQALGLRPGPVVGRVLEQLLQMTWEDPALLDPEGILEALPEARRRVEGGV